jgi:hypothetical protein
MNFFFSLFVSDFLETLCLAKSVQVARLFLSREYTPTMQYRTKRYISVLLIKNRSSSSTTKWKTNKISPNSYKYRIPKLNTSKSYKIRGPRIWTTLPHYMTSNILYYRIQETTATFQWLHSSIRKYVRRSGSSYIEKYVHQMQFHSQFDEPSGLALPLECSLRLQNTSCCSDFL